MSLLLQTNVLLLICVLGSGDYPDWPPITASSIPIGIVIGAIIAILLIGFMLVDLACFKINNQGKQ